MKKKNKNKKANQLFKNICCCTKESTCNAGDPGSIPGSGNSSGEGKGYSLQNSWASLVAQLVKNLPVIRETWVRSLTPVFWRREFHGLYSPRNCRVELDRPTFPSLPFPSLPFIAALGLGCCPQAFSPCGRRGLLSACSACGSLRGRFSLRSTGSRDLRCQ